PHVPSCLPTSISNPPFAHHRPALLRAIFSLPLEVRIHRRIPILTSGFRWPIRRHEHRHPKIRKPSRAAELQINKASFSQKPRERLATPKFDVAAAPKRICVSIPSVEERKKQVFQITVIWCGTNKATAGSQRTITALNESVGIIHVLDYFRADHKIEWFAVQFEENIVITCEDF